MTSSADGQEPEKTYATTVRPAKLPDVVVVPRELVDDAKLSLADLGLWVKLTGYTRVEADLDKFVAWLLAGPFGSRVDVDEAGLRAGVQRLIDAGYVTVDTAGAKKARADRGAAEMNMFPVYPPRS
ncbi:hypothetical protein NX794_33190 [Streptomyces sp. LP11]|uniref:Uncharacterized protein n=1 Tax=Streptomyces pyxinicus TaxID=2970331 RepID=A0ABT2BBX6_9ACTN|nr:hypothetical protein [Streptomyces sp. LP11]MCS0606028.1 hypothetical protein [Streptomyces sp. LP11]